MVSPYFQEFCEDLDVLRLGNRWSRQRPGDWQSWQYKDLFPPLYRTDEIGVVDLPADTPTPQTAAGKTAMRLMEQADELPFNDQHHFGSCANAEPTLLASTSIEAVGNSDYRSPVIVTDGDEPVGIIKSKGEKTCYALETDLERGLVKGCLCAPKRKKLSRAVQNTKSVNHGWYLDLENTDGFVPMRFSAFMTPVEARKSLLPNTHYYLRSEEAAVLTTSHRAIKKAARRILESARRFQY